MQSLKLVLNLFCLSKLLELALLVIMPHLLQFCIILILNVHLILLVFPVFALSSQHAICVILSGRVVACRLPTVRMCRLSVEVIRQ